MKIYVVRINGISVLLRSEKGWPHVHQLCCRLFSGYSVKLVSITKVNLS